MPGIPPPPLKWDMLISLREHQEHKISCGPHAIAAALGLTLEGVRVKLVDYRGWMNPTQMKVALEGLGHSVRYTMGASIKDYLCEGITRLQWEGPWLKPGVPPHVAYHHTHWVAHFGGWVHCTAVDDCNWIDIAHWKRALADMDKLWHATHHYRLPRPQV